MQVSYAIDIVNLSKRFRRHTLTRSGYTTIKSSIVQGVKSLFAGTTAPAEQGHYTQVVKDLTLRIPQGASVGIIGQNGSGKSSLLKLIAGIYKPDQGSIKVNGRVAALIELGAGFHPDFSGRENLYLGGVMHGLSKKEIDARFDRIVSFAELEEVIDDPVRTYSSGMFMRLGFSLAVHTDPDILIVDEVLAVGDAAFVSKCKEQIARLKRSGKTLLLVTHDLDAVERWCDEALWLHAGEVQERGDPRRVIDQYRSFVEHGEEVELQTQEQELQPSAGESTQKVNRWGSREIEITSVHLLNAEGVSHALFHPEDQMSVEVRYRINEAEVSGAMVFGICINRNDGTVAHGSNTHLEKLSLPINKGELGREGTLRYEFSRLGLLDATYTIDVAIHRDDGYPFDYHQGAVTFAVRSPFQQLGMYLPEHRWLLNGKELQALTPEITKEAAYGT